MKIQRGEVIRVNLDPIEGRQASNSHPCLVLSHTKFNAARQGIVIATPITGTVKPEVKIMIPIPEDFKIRGSVIAEQIRTLDLKSRWWKTTGEVLSPEFVDYVVETFKVIIS